MLDVGGGPGALAAFLDDRTVVACDLRMETDPRVAATTLAIADGARLPFADGTFHAVVSLDTLEHVPPEHRPAVLREALGDVVGALLPQGTGAGTDAAAFERLAQQTARAEAAEAQAAGLLAFRDRVLGHPAVRLRRALRRGGSSRNRPF